MALARVRPASGSGADAARTGPIWMLAAVGGAVATALYILVVWRLPAPRHQLPFLTVAALFAVAETALAHLDVGGHTYTYSAVEVPLVLALVALDPKLVVAAWMLGGLIVLGLVQRQPPVKLAYNLASFAVESVTATLVCRAISSGTDPVSPRSMAAVFTAALVTSAVGIASVILAVSKMEGTQRREDRFRYAGFALASTSVTASLTLIGVTLERTRPQVLWLLAPPLVGAWAAQRAFTRQAGRARTVRADVADSSYGDLPRQPEEPGTPQSGHDPLTGLIDREALMQHISRLLDEPGASDLACLVLGLQDLAAVNDSYGGATGDQLLVVTAQRLAGCLREGDVAARLGADRLAVVAHVSPDDSKREAAALARRITDSVARPASLGTRSITASTRVGFAVGRQGDTALRLLEMAQMELASAEPARR